MSGLPSGAAAVHSRKQRRYLFGVGAFVVAIVVILIVLLSSGSSSSDPNGRPVVALSPSSSTFHDGQTITVSVGPNKYFAPYARIIMIQCGDEGGTTANLPTNDSTCDGNTSSGHSVLVNKDGSFSTSYQEIFALPDAQIGDSPDSVPVCNKTHLCVLYVGQDQNNFTAPKVFSAPFAVLPATPSKRGGS